MPAHVEIIQHCIQILWDQVAKCTFRTFVGPGVIIENKDQLGEGPVLLLRHLAIMLCLAVEFGAPWGDSPSSIVVETGTREGLGAEDVLRFEVIIFESDNLADSAWHDALRGTSGRHPPIKREAIDIGGLIMVSLICTE